MTPCRYSGTISIAPNNASCTIHVNMMLRVKVRRLEHFQLQQRLLLLQFDEDEEDERNAANGQARDRRSR